MVTNHGTKMFIVKNDKKGRRFISSAKKFYKKKGFKVRLLGRHHDRKRVEREQGRPVGSYIASIPLKFSERIAFYVYGNNPPIYKEKIGNWKEEFK